MFHSSTHRRWLVPDLEQIRARRAEANEKAVKQLTRAAQQRTSSGALPQFLTAEQELLICHETEQKLVLSCGAIPNIPLSPNVLTCALTYFKRYYLDNSVMNYDTTHMMLASIFLACKIDEIYITLANFIDPFIKANLSPEEDREHREKMIRGIHASEIELLRKLKFQLIVHSPFTALKGLILDLKTQLYDTLDVGELDRRAQALVSPLLLSPAELLLSVPPSQIALAALLGAAQQMDATTVEPLQQFFRDQFGSFGDIDEVFDRCTVFLRALESAPVTAKETLKSAVKLLKKCRNPLCDPSSAIYKQHKEKLFAQREAKQQAKYQLAAQRNAELSERLTGMRADGSLVEESGDAETEFVIKRRKL